MHKNKSGFTLVELLVVIVVIALLASIVVVSYSGVQARSRDTKRRTDVANIAKAMELYYSDTGSYPVPTGSTGSSINASWYNSSDTSWNMLSNLLTKPNESGSAAIDSLPKDPKNTTVSSLSSSGYSYAIFVSQNISPGGYCGTSSKGQMYIIVYRLENGPKEFRSEGNCSTNPLGESYASGSGASIYRNVKSGA